MVTAREKAWLRARSRDHKMNIRNIDLNSKVQHPPASGNTADICTFEDNVIQIPASRGQKSRSNVLIPSAPN